MVAAISQRLAGKPEAFARRPPLRPAIGVAKKTHGPGAPLNASQLLSIQRSAGNRATARLVAESKRKQVTVQRSGDRPVVQRIQQHFFKFLNTQLPALDASKATEKSSLLAAWILDQNIYEIEAMLKGTYTEQAHGDVLNNIALLAKKGLTPTDVRDFLAAAGAPGPGSEGQMAWLNAALPEMTQKLTEAIAEQKKAQGGESTSIIRWHGLTSWGAGTGASLMMNPGGIPAGSSAGGDPVWMKQVEQHLPSTGNTTLYVRGHLLNYDLGGPGLDYNMVPITGKPAKNVGGNDANGEHYHAVESAAKTVLGHVLAGRYRQAVYEVVPVYNRPARAESALVRQQAVTMRGILNTAVDKRRTAIAAKGAVAVEHDYRALHTTLGATVPFPLPSFSDQVETLTRYEAHRFESQTFGTMRSSLDPVALDIVARIPKGILDASTQGKADLQSPKGLLGALEGNASTWEAEDRHIPTALKVRLEWADSAGTKGALTVPDIPVTLSTDTAKVYFRPKKNAEDA